jgi:hypothetical protein
MENSAGGAFQEQSNTVAITVNVTGRKQKISRQLCNLN